MMLIASIAKIRSIRMYWIKKGVKCNMASSVIDMMGQSFGKWTVLAFARTEKVKGSIWLARCECGTEREVIGSTLRYGRSTNCGCWQITHGQSVGKNNSPTYRSFQAAKRRCTNPNTRDWKWYGGKGIQFLFDSVADLMADIGERPDGDYTLDRIDGNGNYERGNVRWLSIGDQQRNRENNLWIEIDGVSRLAHQWSELGGAKPGTIYGRIHRGFCPSCAVFNLSNQPCPHGTGLLAAN